MSQSASNMEKFAGEVPADLRCGFCKSPLQGSFYRTLNRFACAKCAGQVNAALEKNVAAPGALLKAAAGGAIVAALCAAAWAAIVQITHMEIGIVASFIGVGVAKAVYHASGKRRGTPYQIIAALLSVLGILGGKLLLTGWQVADILSQKNIAATPMQIADIVLRATAKNPSEVFGGFDLLWVGIAIYAAWRICKAPTITVAGPFPLNPAPANAMQFDTVEPHEPAETSEPPEAH